MKVVLFCGGQGTRLREYSDAIPKPMVPIGDRPILWHVMKYYAFFGHKDFILCLGYHGTAIKEYFLNYKESLSNDFVLSKGGSEIQLFNSDIHDWSITFVDTGIHTSIGERLKAVEPHVQDEEMFLANYSDGLTDLWLPDYLDEFHASDKTAAFVAVHSPQSFHIASVANDGVVNGIGPLSESGHWINGGFFAFRNEFFDDLHPGEDLVAEPFQRLIKRQALMAYRYEGFWRPMDTFKDKQAFDDLYESGAVPWEFWKTASPPEPAPPKAAQSPAGR